MNDVLHQSLLILLNALVMAIVWGLKRAADYMATRSKSESVASFWHRLDDLAERVVKEVYAAYVKPLQDAGQWTDMAAAKAKEQAVARLRAYLGAEGLRVLEYLFGGSRASTTLDAFLATFVEAAVRDQKAAGSVTAALAAGALPLAAPAKP